MWMYSPIRGEIYLSEVCGDGIDSDNNKVKDNNKPWIDLQYIQSMCKVWSGSDLRWFQMSFVQKSTLLLCTLHSPPFSNRLWPDPANSDGPSKQSIGLPTESIRLDQILLQVWCKSGQSLVKPSWSSKALDWLDWPVHQTSTGLPLDFKGRKEVKYNKSPVHWTSNGLPTVLDS